MTVECKKWHTAQDPPRVSGLTSLPTSGGNLGNALLSATSDPLVSKVLELRGQSEPAPEQGVSNRMQLGSHGLTITGEKRFVRWLGTVEQGR